MVEDGDACPLKEGRRKICFDDALRHHLGEFGTFTRRMVALICLEEMFCTFQMMVPVFLAAVPVFWCSAPGVEMLGNCTRWELDEITVPWKKTDGSLKPDQCRYYERNYSQYSSNYSGQCSGATWSSDNASTGYCSSWEFDNSQLGNTMVVEWDFVCSRAWMASTVAAVFLGGRSLGNVVFGWLADRFGRKKIILGAGLLNLAAGAACAAAPNFVFFLVMRFLHAALVTGKSNTGFVCALEFSGPSWRVFSSNMYMLAWAFGLCLMSGICFLLRYHSWRILLMALLIPEIVYYPLVYFFMPESPRWLYLRERREEADRVVCHIAKINKKTLPKDLQVYEKRDVSSRSPWDLVRTPKIRVLTIILAYIWAANGFVYYGLTLNTGNLGGSTYINFLISGAVEIPAYILIIVVFHRWGRIWPFSMSMILGGAALLLIAALPQDLTWAVVTFAMIGKFFISASFAIVWIYSAEAYPTCIRNLGVTVTGVAARLSSPISPYIAHLGDTNKALPYVIFGALSLVGGLLILFLPETRGVRMPQTIQDGEELCRKNRVNLKFWQKKKEVSFDSVGANETPNGAIQLKC